MERHCTIADITHLGRAWVLPHPERTTPALAPMVRDDEIERIAIAFVTQHEEARGWQVESVESENRGFDLISRRSHPEDPKTFIEVRFIEVKGRAGVGEIALTANEYKTAGRLKSDYWLYAVFNCGGTPELHAIQDPCSARLDARRPGRALPYRSGKDPRSRHLGREPQSGAGSSWSIAATNAKLPGGLILTINSRCMSKAKKSKAPKAAGLTFDRLVLSIRGVDSELAAQAGRAVNISLTLRNWLVGCYIADMSSAARTGLNTAKSCWQTCLSGLLQVASVGPKSANCGAIGGFIKPILRFGSQLAPELRKHLASSAIGPPGPIRESPTPESGLSGKELVTKLSFTHIAELLAIQDTPKRAFYETECIRGNWGVRELKRQIASLYFERSGLSLDKSKLTRRLLKPAPAERNRDLTIRDPYIFVCQPPEHRPA